MIPALLPVGPTEAISAGYAAQAVHAVNMQQALARQEPLLGIVNSGTIAFSFWIYFLTQSSGDHIFQIANNVGPVPRFKIRLGGLGSEDDRLRVIAWAPLSQSGTQRYDMETAALPLDTWLHIAGAINVAGVSWMRVDDVSNAVINPGSSPGDIGFDAESPSIFTSKPSSIQISGNYYLADLWIAPNQYLANTEANRRRLSTVAGKPVDLGNDGSGPLLGTAPAVFISGDKDQWNAGTNRGSGGNFFPIGSGAALLDAPSSPSD